MKNKYHKALDPQCSVTKTAHRARQIRMKDDGTRDYFYLLLVFPEDVKIDNSMTHWNKGTVHSKHMSMEHRIKGDAAQEEENGEKLIKYDKGFCVYWEIFEVGVINGKEDDHRYRGSCSEPATSRLQERALQHHFGCRRETRRSQGASAKSRSSGPKQRN